MNLQSRLNKLESNRLAVNRDQCACAPVKYETFSSLTGGDLINAAGEVYSPELQTCSDCKKEIARNVILILGVEGSPSPDLYGPLNDDRITPATFNIKTKKEN